ncbi:sarcosine oxidase [Fusarium albosuccineum]|uniref:Sarcosine oxidase n=1 Tax=Fusarium albosuccineum TaxID=1237068 RepID=A0A8H4PHG5_9HYPO|nr:sarcosine oxidase [Fusarium albosuccineum]
MPTPPAKTDPIIIVGAGIFGLSTAIHLAWRGYTDVTVFDKQPYEKTLYSYTEGCDAASADINKIIRSAYGAQTEYQDLSTEALKSWDAWNAELKQGGAAIPPGMTSSDVVWVNNGFLSLTDASTLPEFKRATVENMEATGHPGTQLINNDETHIRIAADKGRSSAMNPFSKKALGVLDTTGGIAIADKACRFALHKAKSLGVRFILDHEAGRLTSTIQDSNGKVTGIRTADGKSHFSSITIIAAGGWTPTLVPSLDNLAETTAGSVIILKIPESSPLRQRFSPSRFPSYSYKVRDGAEGGIYGFPVDKHGHLKIGYRGTKYTNPKVQADGKERSEPVTRWTEGERITKIPEQALHVLRRFLDEYLPELGAEGIDIWLTRLCWYNDSFDNHYVIDRVPGHEGLVVATAGSGHAFKYLPNIGNWVVDILEGVGLDRPSVKAWRWREKKDGDAVVNSLMEGATGERALANVRLASADAPSSKL